MAPMAYHTREHYRVNVIKKNNLIVNVSCFGDSKIVSFSFKHFVQGDLASKSSRMGL